MIARRFVLLSIILLTFLNGQILARTRITAGLRLGQRFPLQTENGKTTLEKDFESFLYGGSLFYNLTQKSEVGLLVDFWKREVNFDGIGGAPEYGDFLKVYRIGITHKYLVAKLPRAGLRASIGGSVNYYKSHIDLEERSTGEERVRMASYNNFGFGIIGEIGFRWLNWWSELSHVKLANGNGYEKWLWEYLGGVSEINLSGLSTGLEFSLNF